MARQRGIFHSVVIDHLTRDDTGVALQAHVTFTVEAEGDDGRSASHQVSSTVWNGLKDEQLKVGEPVDDDGHRYRGPAGPAAPGFKERLIRFVDDAARRELSMAGSGRYTGSSNVHSLGDRATPWVDTPVAEEQPGPEKAWRQEALARIDYVREVIIELRQREPSPIEESFLDGLDVNIDTLQELVERAAPAAEVNILLDGLRAIRDKSHELRNLSANAVLLYQALDALLSRFPAW